MKNLRTHILAVDFVKEAQKLKITSRVMRDQFERASLSIALNIAEGCGRRYKNERKKFYSIALGSLRETQSCLMILQKEELLKKADILGAHLYRLFQNPGGL